MKYANLTNEELARHADLALDPITSTDLERELLKRFESFVDENEADKPLQMKLVDFGIEDPNVLETALQLHADYPAGRALLDVLTDLDIDDPKALRSQLERLSKFDQVVQDLVEPITTLQSLATTV